MLKSLSILALTGILTVPALAMAGSSGATQAELEQRIEELSRQLDELKAEMSKQKEVVNEYVDTVDTLDERSEAWDLASRFELSAEFRSRGDFYRAKNVFSAGTPLGMTGMDAATGMPIFGGEYIHAHMGPHHSANDASHMQLIAMDGTSNTR